jgi:hypothetical protein
MSALGGLAPFARGWRPVPRAGERCEVCAAELDEQRHRHLVDVERRKLLCVCQRCRPPHADRYRLVPSRVLVDPDFTFDDAQWAALEIPVRLAFIFFSSPAGRWVAFYPSPAGAAESELPLGGFSVLSAATPLVRAAAPDVEALLIHGRPGSPFETFLVPIDVCYALVGKVRLTWRGFHGGDRAWRELAAFFADLRARAEVVR